MHSGLTSLSQGRMVQLKSTQSNLFFYHLQIQVNRGNAPWKEEEGRLLRWWPCLCSLALLLEAENSAKHMISPCLKVSVLLEMKQKLNSVPIQERILTHGEILVATSVWQHWRSLLCHIQSQEVNIIPVCVHGLSRDPLGLLRAERQTWGWCLICSGDRTLRDKLMS